MPLSGASSELIEFATTMNQQLRLFRVCAALIVFAAAVPLPAVAQMRVQIGAGSGVVVPIALPSGSGVVPSAGIWANSPAPIGLSAALAAPSVVLSPLAAAVPAAAPEPSSFLAAAPAAPALAAASAEIPAAIRSVVAAAAAPVQGSAAGRVLDAISGRPAASVSFDGVAEKPSVDLEAPASPAAPSMSAELRESIWSKKILPSAYSTLPRSRSGVKALMLRTFLHMGRTFDDAGDELPSSRGGYKIFHPFGTVLKIRYDAVPGHSFTGLFADRGVPGLMRLSLALPPTSAAFIPGGAFKLFIDGRSSANAVFLNEKGLDGQQPDRNFFARSFTNVLPKPKGLAVKIAAFFVGLFNRFNALRIPVDALAAHHADGSPVDEPRAPYRLLLKPAPGLGNDPNTAKDFRVELGGLPSGPLFEVYASQTPQGPLVRVGDIHAESAPVASEYGDTGLFFQHRRVAR